MRYPLFGTGLKGKSPNLTDQHRLNLYLEKREEDDKSPMCAYGTPGKGLKVSFGETPIRAMDAINDLFYVVHRGTFYSVNNAAEKTALGSLLTTSGRCSMQDNGNIIQIIDGQYGYTFNIAAYNTVPVAISTITYSTTTATVTTSVPHNLFTGYLITVTGATPAAYNVTNAVITVTGDTTFTYTMLSNPGGNASVVGAYAIVSFSQITDPDFIPGFTNTWLDGYFIKDRRGSSNRREWGRFDVSTDGSTYDALDFANAESNPDPLERVFADRGQCIMFGKVTTEFWTDSGTLDFPLSYQGSSTIEWGLAAKWSVAKFNNSVMFLARNLLGQVQVVLLNGYTPQVVSGVDLGYIINRYPAVEDATAFSYMVDNHPMYQINFPTANATWLFDGQTGAWTELESGGGRDRGEIGITFLDEYLISDYENGNIYRLEPDTYTDNGMTIRRQITTRHVFDETYVGIGRIILDIEPGVGLIQGQGFDPQIMLEVSKDGGHTWGQQLWRSFGKIGEYTHRAIWNRIGVSRDYVYRFTVTDPVKVVIIGAWLDVVQ